MRGWRLDLVVTAGFVAFALTEEAVVRMPGAWWPFALAVFTGLVAVRRRVPLIGLVASCVQLFYPDVAVSYRLWQLVAMIIFSFTAGRRFPPPRRLGWVGLALVLATGATYWSVAPADPMGSFFFPLAPWGLGVALAVQQRQSVEAAGARAAIREQRAREAVMEERVRIARELHDMVAHSVTVMVIQAGVVRRRLDAGLPVDGDLLRSIESSGRDAVGELRRTLGLLRGEGAADPPVGLERLDELLAQMREAGLEVELRREGEAVPLAPAADLSAYRIVQEALTNVLKHAGPTVVTVVVRYADDGLHLTIVDRGARANAGGGPIAGAGQGLIGMRERAALFGGQLRAGRRPGGGFEVHATLPVPPRALERV
ncbi:sensor histidine kinase [Dactylosporangium sp. CA-233914]|uniref:sensor histidine kinase n=1 Tax=Dactylosporangium sp. CA-233914 TaxID=3239934 RepID=UPI003D8F29D2